MGSLGVHPLRQIKDMVQTSFWPESFFFVLFIEKIDYAVVGSFFRYTAVHDHGWTKPVLKPDYTQCAWAKKILM